MIRIFSIAAFLFCLLIPKIDVSHPADQSAALEKFYRLGKPEGVGPFPAVMMVAGGSGFNATFAKGHYDAVQGELVKLGFVTLRVDYLGARNAASFMEVSVELVATDIAATAEYLRHQPFVKKGAINLIGWSYGGASALQALGRTYNRKAVEVDAVVAYYPACNLVQQKWESEVPVLVLVGTADNVAPLRHCEFFSVAYLPIDLPSGSMMMLTTALIWLDCHLKGRMNGVQLATKKPPLSLPGRRSLSF